MTDASAQPKPAVPFIKFDSAGEPFIQGLRCRSCGAVMIDERLACPACGARDGFDSFRAAQNGKLHAYSIVRRSYPGVPVPFVSAIVDLEDGLSLKGNLVAVAPEPEALPANLPVRLVFGDALGRRDKEDASYIAYFFEPAV
jgi:uncharacterized OB-fold protein